MAIPRPRYKSKKRRQGKFKQGFYKPINEVKYRQPQDRTMNKEIFPEYRSSWELAFFKYCDTSANVEFWSVESFPIPYISPKDNKEHRYYVDVMFKTTNGKKFLIEIKPNKQKTDPVNQAKWDAARLYCKKVGAIFLVITEIELKKFGLIK